MDSRTQVYRLPLNQIEVKKTKHSEIMAEFCRPLPRHNLACAYCASTHPLASYQEHLVVAHCDLLFRCEECDSFVDRKHFGLHMSFHASPVLPAPSNNTYISFLPLTVKTETSDPENESDGFEPPPESVTETIEDSQDSQRNTASWLRKKYKLKDCSVVLTPINVNDYIIPVNTVVKNNLNNPLAMPAAKTCPKTTDTGSVNDFLGFAPVECRAASFHFYQLRHSLNHWLK